jgi:hypothetical protein
VDFREPGSSRISLDEIARMIYEGLKEQAQRAVCSIPPIQVTLNLDSYLGIGSSASAGLSFSLATGQISFVVSSTLGIGYGGGISVGIGNGGSPGVSIGNTITGGFGNYGVSVGNGGVAGARSGYGPQAGVWGGRTITMTTNPTPELYNACH